MISTIGKCSCNVTRPVIPLTGKSFFWLLIRLEDRGTTAACCGKGTAGTGQENLSVSDKACTYQFYEHRGFARVCEKEIVLGLETKRSH